METSRLMYGSIGAGVVVGILLLGLLGWIPFYGWIIAGFAAGLASRGSARGLGSGLLAGIIVSAVAIAVTLFVPVSALNTIFYDVGNQYLNKTVFATVYTTISLPTIVLVKKLVVDLIVLPGIGAFIGGSILTNGYHVVEVHEEEESPAPKAKPAQSPKTAKIVEEDKEEVSA